VVLVVVAGAAWAWGRYGAWQAGRAATGGAGGVGVGGVDSSLAQVEPALSVGPRGPAGVDAKLVGRWRLEQATDNAGVQRADVQATYVISAAGHYRLETVTRDHGNMQMQSDGTTFRMYSSAGGSVRGTLEVLDATTMSMRDPFGTHRYLRVGTPVSTDRPWAGEWQTAFTKDHTPWQLQYRFSPNGTGYELVTTTADEGTIQAGEGTLATTSQATGQRITASYRQTNDDMLTIRGPGGTTTWARQE
jgi:hypothetical protein